MGLYKRGRIWWLKFQIHGREIRMSTGCRNKRKALAVEARIRDQLALGNWGILERQPAPALTDFIRDSFLPFVEAHYENPNSRRNNKYGSEIILKSSLAAIPMDQLTTEHVAKLLEENSHYAGATKNVVLKTLRLILSKAMEWGRIGRKIAIKGVAARRRERVVTLEEEASYLDQCREPWRTMAMLMLDCGLRPEECIHLKWISVDLEQRRLQVTRSKTKAGLRTLMISDRALAGLRMIERSSEYVFAARRSHNREGCVSNGYMVRQHDAAIEASGVKYFEPYCLRHTCLTRMAEYTPLPVLMVIAGHSNIAMTMRYVHPSKASVEEAFLQQQKNASSGYKSRHKAKMRVFSGGSKGK